MNAPTSSRHCTTVSTPLIPQIADKCDREGKRATLTAVSMGSQNAILTPGLPSSPAPEQDGHR
jgi:hypothetical protein